MAGAGEGALPEALVHHVEGPVEPLVVLPARGVEQIELMDVAAVPLPEVERGDADEAHRRTEVELAEQRLRRFDDRPRGVGRIGEEGLPRMQPEIRRAQLHPDPRRLQPLAAQPARDGVRGTQQPGADGGLPR